MGRAKAAESSGIRRTPNASPDSARRRNSRSVWSAAYSAALALMVVGAFGCATRPHRLLADAMFNVQKQFGAIPDGKTLCTTNIQQALDECGRSGGGTVFFPPGTYLSQPLTLRTKTILF